MLYKISLPVLLKLRPFLNRFVVNWNMVFHKFNFKPLILLEESQVLLVLILLCVVGILLMCSTVWPVLKDMVMLHCVGVCVLVRVLQCVFFLVSVVRGVW